MSSGASSIPGPGPNTPVAITTPQKTIVKPLNLWESFMCGGLAGCVAVTVSNPAEVIKTRLQLQGELQKADSNAPKVYKNAADVLTKTLRNEGLKGMQKGIFPAYGYQILLNGSRLGFYDPVRRLLNRVVGLDPDAANVGTALTAGAITGCIGAAAGSPLFLVKARIQAYSPALPVGAQHYYRNSLDALSQILKEGGVRGLWRGVNAALLRTAMGSSVQLPSYNLTKSLLGKAGYSETSYATSLAASMVSGVAVCAAMQPADTVLTRMYNQNTIKDPVTGRVRGALYNNPFDCLWKTFKTEGVAGWYKGTTAHFMRIFPHTVVTLVANEVIMTQYRKIRGDYKEAAL